MRNALSDEKRSFADPVPSTRHPQRATGNGLRAEGSRINSTVLGADSVENWGLLDRVPRVISTEFDPRLGAIIR